MKRLNQLPAIADELLGGLHATEQLKESIKADGARLRAGQKSAYQAHGWAARKGGLRVRPQMVMALACALVLLVGASVGVPALLRGRPDMTITTQTGGESGLMTVPGQDSALLDVPKGSISISQRDKPAYRGIWAAASGANFPLICVDGRYYRLLTNPTSLGSDLTGSPLGQVTTYTSEPSLASGGIISNTVGEGETVYAVKGMNGAMVAASLNGAMRVFQRVSFGSNALLGGEGLSATLCADKVIALELTGVGTVTDSAKAKELYNILIANASLARAGASETGTSLLIALNNGLALQLCVRDESVMGCGTWNCPEFFEAFTAAVQ